MKKEHKMKDAYKKEIIPILRALAELHNTSEDKNLQKWAKRTLHWACRNLELVTMPPRVSKKAAQKARQMKIAGSLADYNWNQQPTKMHDPSRKIFEWDHIYPVSQLRDAILKDSLSDTKLKQHLDNVEIAWILKEEDKALNANGYHSKRLPPPPMNAYIDTKIELL